MKLSKNLGRVATTFLATAMLASLTAVPAFAADGEEGAGSAPTTPGTTTENKVGVGDYRDDPQLTADVNIYKDITKPNNVYLPNETFAFTIDDYGYTGEGDPSWKDGATIPESNDDIVSAPGAALVTEGLPNTYATSEIVTNGDGTNHTVRLADTMTIHLDAEKFSDPGEYKFLITETQGDYETGLSYPAQNLILNVIVSRGTGDNENTMYIAGYELFTTTVDAEQTIEPTATKTDAFHNDYAIDDEEKDQTKDFDLTKQVTGTAATSADEAKHYEFHITITNSSTPDGTDPEVPAQYKKYAVTMTHTDCSTSDRQDIQNITEGTQSTFKLAEGDTFHIDGLTANDKIVIEEVNADGFTVSYKTVNGDTFSTEDPFATVTATPGASQTINTVNTNYKTEFTNNKDAVTPTGIVMNVAPYALLVVVAAAGCFVFLRKRRED